MCDITLIESLGDYFYGNGVMNNCCFVICFFKIKKFQGFIWLWYFSALKTSLERGFIKPFNTCSSSVSTYCYSFFIGEETAHGET